MWKRQGVLNNSRVYASITIRGRASVASRAVIAMSRTVIGFRRHLPHSSPPMKLFDRMPPAQSWRLIAAAASLLTAACIHIPPSRELVAYEPAGAILFHDVSVFAATSNESLAHQDVWVRDGRIASLGPTQPLAAADGVRVVEGAGKTLLPGLIDVHTHPTGSGAPFYRMELPDEPRNLQAHLYVGVTTIDVAGGDPDKLRDLSRDVESGKIPGPRMFYAGRIISQKDGYPADMVKKLLPFPISTMATNQFTAQITTPEEGRAAVRDNISKGTAFAKVAVTELPDTAPRLDAAELAAIVDEAHQHHQKVVAHVDSASDALLCARTGVDALWHDVQLDKLDPAQVAEIAAHIHTVAPTLSTFDAFDGLTDGTIAPSALLRQTESPGLVQSLIDAPKHIHEIPPELGAWMARLHANHAGRRANVKALHDAGVTILVGTDANGSDGSVPASIHEELVALHEAGLENSEVLLGATARAARFLDANADYGTIEPGKVADLLLVDGDPLADIHATAQIALVVSRGRVVKRLPGFAQ